MKDNLQIVGEEVIDRIREKQKGILVGKDDEVRLGFLPSTRLIAYTDALKEDLAEAQSRGESHWVRSLAFEKMVKILLNQMTEGGMTPPTDNELWEMVAAVEE